MGREQAGSWSKEEFDALVREWEGPIYNLALRMTGNAADAADGTQEVFVKIFRQLRRFDRDRPLKPWIFRVARNVLLNRLRAAERRRRREAEHARSAAAARAGAASSAAIAPAGEDPVAQSVLALEPDARALLLLHYYHDLTQVELAEALEVPRTTIQDRIARARAALEQRLRASGSFALVPSLEQAMRGAAPLPVPTELSASLMASAAAAAAESGAATALGVLVKGIVMSKKIAALAALALVLSVTAGWVGGRASARKEGAGEAPAPGASFVTAAEHETLRQKHDALARELAALRAAPARPERAAAAPAALHPAPAAHAAAAIEAAGATAATPEGALDWRRFSALFAARVDAIDAAFGDDGHGNMRAEDQEKVFELIAEMSRLVAAAREIAPYPLFDGEIFPGLVDALFGESLSLTAAQRDALQTLAREALEQTLRDIDLGRLAPTENVRLRDLLLGDVLAAIPSLLDEGQLQRWERIARVVDRMLGMNRRAVEISLAGKTDDALIARVVEEWIPVFGFADAERAPAETIARGFIAGVRALFGTADESGAGAPARSEEEVARLASETRQLQIEAERALIALLSDEQLARLAEKIPVLFRFNDEGREGVDQRVHATF
ncbi:MAG: sigma-70 family RNA polymerase sigma factor [Planctomycetes bacterium]|nr:sigma-70 family RNA polymerase sigma factor [Planctomycetota bacterium]